MSTRLKDLGAISLNITVVSGVNLMKTDLFSTPDPFVRISIGSEVYSTKSVKKSLSPVWNQSFTVDVLATSIMKLSVWNLKKFVKKQHTGFMGSVDIPLAFVYDLEPGKTLCSSYNLSTKASTTETCGTIFISFSARSNKAPVDSSPMTKEDPDDCDVDADWVKVEAPTAPKAAHDQVRTPQPESLPRGRVNTWDAMESRNIVSATASTSASRPMQKPPAREDRPINTWQTPPVATTVRRASESPAVQSTTTAKPPSPMSLHASLNARHGQLTSQNAAPTTPLQRSEPNKTQGTLPEAAMSSQAQARELAIQAVSQHKAQAASQASNQQAKPDTPSTDAAPAKHNASIKSTSQNTPTSTQAPRVVDNAAEAQLRDRAESSQQPSLALAKSIRKTKAVDAATIQLLREPLPDGWEARLTPNGQVYYANHFNRKTQWDRPTKPAIENDASTEQRLARRAYNSRRSLMQTTDKADDDFMGEETGPRATLRQVEHRGAAADTNAATVPKPLTREASVPKINTSPRLLDQPRAEPPPPPVPAMPSVLTATNRATAAVASPASTNVLTPGPAPHRTASVSGGLSTPSIFEASAAPRSGRVATLSTPSNTSPGHISPAPENVANNSSRDAASATTSSSNAATANITTSTSTPTTATATTNAINNNVTSNAIAATPTAPATSAIAVATAIRAAAASLRSDPTAGHTPTHTRSASTGRMPVTQVPQAAPDTTTPRPRMGAAAVVTTKDKDWREYEVEEDLGEFPVGWEQRTTPSGVVYFVDHIHRTTTFEDPRIAANEQRRKEALAHESTLPQYKRDLRRKLLRLRHLFLLRRQSVFKTEVPKIDVFVNRETIFEDSYQIIMNLSPSMMLGKLNIKFLNEDALDYGGVAREWFYQLSREMLNPYYGLFEQLSSDQYLLAINPNSSINPDHLSYFRFIGRIMGLAVVNGHFLDGAFVNTIYKLLLNKNVSLEDMAQVDATFYNGLVWMLENDITDVLENTFTDEHDVFGAVEQVELKPGGADIPVTESNKREYVKLIVRYRLLRGIAEQMDAMKRGFSEIVPVEFLDMFDEKELELVIGGLGEIDLDDWKANTEYRYCDESDRTVQWFWTCLSQLDNEMRARVLQFVTGTSRVPITGFKDLRGSQGPKKFTLEYVASASKGSLPKAHTCFNRLDLPPFDSQAQMLDKLVMSVEETMGFGLE